MKTLILTFITLAFTSCGTIKSLNRIKSNTATNESINTNEKTFKLQTYTRAITLTDSTQNLYKIVIYPLDTFQFSIGQGFKGKASKVELTALTKHLTHQIDTTTFTNLTDHQKQLNSNKKTMNKSVILNKTSKHTKSYWFLILSLAIVLAVGIVWIYRKLR